MVFFYSCCNERGMKLKGIVTVVLWSGERCLMEGTPNIRQNGWRDRKSDPRLVDDAWGPPGIMGRKSVGTTPTPTTPICETPLPETDEDYAEYYQDKISAAQHRQLYPLLEDIADWINKCLGKWFTVMGQKNYLKNLFWHINLKISSILKHLQISWIISWNFTEIWISLTQIFTNFKISTNFI